MNMEKIEWTLHEYKHQEKTNDWFWALGIIVLASTITSIIYDNYFFAAVILLGGILMWHFSIKKPELVKYELNKDGFKVKNRIYPYKEIKSFHLEEPNKDRLFLKTNRFFVPMLIIPVQEELSLKIKEFILKKKIKEEEMEEHASDKIMDFLGF